VVDYGTSAWEEGAWSERRGYPHVITFHKARLWSASTDTDSQHIWSSRIRDYENFQDGSDDDDAIVDKVASDKVEVARWLATGRALLMGTAGGEHAIIPASDSAGLTPASVQIEPQTPYGSSAMKPLRVADTVLFGERDGAASNPARKIREIVYSDTKTGYVAPDDTVISEHITGEGVTEGAFQAAPLPVAWFFVQMASLRPSHTSKSRKCAAGICTRLAALLVARRRLWSAYAAFPVPMVMSCG
jgi:hypothetical protein